MRQDNVAYSRIQQGTDFRPIELPFENTSPVVQKTWFSVVSYLQSELNQHPLISPGLQSNPYYLYRGPESSKSQEVKGITGVMYRFCQLNRQTGENCDVPVNRYRPQNVGS